MAFLVIGGQPNPANPARALNAVFQPSATEPMFVHYSVRITTDSSAGAVRGRVELRSDAANPPVTVRARIACGINESAPIIGSAESIVEGVLSYLVPAGHNVLLATVDEAGVPTYALTVATEIA